jgi:hypothetical protein
MREFPSPRTVTTKCGDRRDRSVIFSGPKPGGLNPLRSMRLSAPPSVMGIVLSTSDETTYRRILRTVFDDVRRGLFRVRCQFSQSNGAIPPSELVDLLARRVKHLRSIVAALAEAPVPIEPTISPHLAMAYAAALTAIDECIAAGKPAVACELADWLVALIAIELTWLERT